MRFPLKFLKQQGEPFLPLTAAEAVMVKHSTGIRRLDEVLREKIEEVVTPVGSGLTSYPIDDGVVITHSNSIDPSVDELQPKLIKYDNRGHIVETGDFGNLRIMVDGQSYVEYNGASSAIVNLGDDFMDSNGYIQIRWNTIT